MPADRSDLVVLAVIPSPPGHGLQEIRPNRMKIAKIDLYEASLVNHALTVVLGITALMYF